MTKYGCIGPNTMSKLFGCTICIGASGASVLDIEKKLQNLGYYTGALDSSFGSVLQESVSKFQGDHGLIQCGCVGTNTLNAINSSKVVIPSDVQIYLTPSINCQSNNSTIINAAKSIIGNAKDLLTKGTLIFNWVRDNTAWIDYYDTRLGALGLYNARPRNANCTDMAHLIIALARAAGIPARYMHVLGDFSHGYIGHTVAQLWINGVWENADATDNRNTLGNVVNWKMGKDSVIYGYYQALPY